MNSPVVPHAPATKTVFDEKTNIGARRAAHGLRDPLHGCLHCKEQLEAFVKRERQISEAGLKLIAVSSDNQAGIKGSLADYGPARFPFLMVADPELKTVQAYRTYDSFEQIALHGIFLVDGARLCRWQDVGFEPFRDVDFVLAESKRLLQRPVAPPEAGASCYS